MNNTIAFKSHENGMKVAEILLKEGYIVLLSYEEDLLIVNWEWCESGYANRNDVVFMPRCDFDEKYYEIIKDDNYNNYDE